MKKFFIVIILVVIVALGFVMFRSKSATTPKDSSTESVIKLGESRKIGSITITPIEIVEDSRCPKDVQCIQAGTVRVKTNISRQGGDSLKVISLGQSVVVGTTTIELLEVEPVKKEAKQIEPADYRLTYKLK